LKYVLTIEGENTVPDKTREQKVNIVLNTKPRTFFETAEKIIEKFYTEKYRIALDPIWVITNYSLKAHLFYARVQTPRHVVIGSILSGILKYDKYKIIIDDEQDTHKIYMEIGSKPLEILITENIAVVGQKNGRAYVYRNYAPICSYTALLAGTAMLFRRLKTFHEIFGLDEHGGRIETVEIRIDPSATFEIDRTLELKALEWLVRRRQRSPA